MRQHHLRPIPVPEAATRPEPEPAPARQPVEVASEDPYVIAMPVPNITGSLHIGHALNLVIQDVFARHAMSTGRTVSFLPGVDHAGLGGQLAAERAWQAEGVTKRSLGRSGVVREMHRWHDRHQADLLRQMRALELSAAWGEAVSSMDTRRQELVQDAFIQLWSQDLVYRDECLVNWCTSCETCIPNEEIDREELTRTAYHVVVRSDRGELYTLATLHPHLLLAATGVRAPVGHPAADAAAITLPIVDRLVPVHVGSEPRDRVLGTALSLVLPCYNADDFERARAHGERIEPFYNGDGTVVSPIARYDGRPDREVQALVVADLEARGELVGREPYLHGQAHHGACGGMVVPRPTRQWFLRLDGLRSTAADLAEADPSVTRFNHPRWQARYRDVLRLIANDANDAAPWWEGACLAFVRGFSSNRDWMLSRQNWWGIPVPAFHCEACSAIQVERLTSDTANRACPVCPVCGEPMVASDDVLDVLVHSALWAYCVTPDASHSPHADLAVIGHDILEFWIPTANVLTSALFDVVSIGDVFVHGVICDDEGRKMSKSLGNTISLEDLLDRHDVETVRALMLSLAGVAATADLVPLSPAATDEPDAFVAALRSWLDTVEVTSDRGAASDAMIMAEAERLVARALADLEVAGAYRVVRGVCQRMQRSLVIEGSALASFARLLEPFHPTLARSAFARSVGDVTD